jgi:hypothetical protein
MKPIFPKSLDFLIRATGAFLGFSILTGVAAYTYFTLPVVQDTGYRPEQPVPYSHKLHAGNRKSYATGEPVKWVKVHNLPDYAYFNHSAHVTAGVSCVSCHGRVDQMVEVTQVQPLNMGWCLECHRNPAPNLRPAELVTKLDWEPPAGKTRAEIGMEIVKAKNINPPVHCGGCHR